MTEDKVESCFTRSKVTLPVLVLIPASRVLYLDVKLQQQKLHEHYIKMNGSFQVGSLVFANHNVFLFFCCFFHFIIKVAYIGMTGFHAGPLYVVHIHYIYHS